MATRVKTGGRTRGSLDANERKLLSSRYAKHIDQVYMKLGGPEFLLTWAQDNPSEFIKQCWARIAPAFMKDDPDIQINQQFNVNNLSDKEIAARIAFALNKGMEQPAIEMTPQEACKPPRWQASQDLPPEPSITPEQLAELVEAQRAEALSNETYCGSAAEQGLSPAARRRRRDQLI